MFTKIASLESNSRVLIIVNGVSIDGTDGKTFLQCEDTQSANLQTPVIDYIKFFTLPESTNANNIALIMDTPLDLAQYESYLKLGAPSTNSSNQSRAYQFMMRGNQSKNMLTSELLKILESSKEDKLLSMFSIGYRLAPYLYPSFHLYLKGSDDGDFFFTDAQDISPHR